MVGSVLPLCLLLAATLRDSLPDSSGLKAHTRPVLCRLWMLEEQEVTLSRLESIARNYIISYNTDSRFRSLAEQVEAANAARAALQCKEAGRVSPEPPH